MKRKTPILMVLLFWYAIALGQDTLYTETFSGQNGQGAYGPTSGMSSITLNLDSVDWTIDTSQVGFADSNDYALVVSEKLEFRDTDGKAKWISPSIDISNKKNVTLSLALSEVGTMEASDSIAVYYQVDNGSEIEVLKISDDFSSRTLSDTVLSAIGDSLFLIVYGLNGADDEKYRLDDIYIKGTSIESTSEIEPPNSTISADTFSSLRTTVALAKDIFRFKITDAGSGDGLATKITQLTFKTGSSNTANWTNTIQGVTLNDGGSVTISNTTITDSSLVLSINTGNLSVSDNSSQELTLGLYLNSSNISDNDTVQVRIDADALGFTTDTSGSAFKDTINSGVDIVSSKFTLHVEASELRLVQNATNAFTQAFMLPYPRVEATDSNGNRDTDLSNTVSATSTGTLDNSPVNESMVNGLATFDSIKHTATGTGLQLSFTSTGLTGVNSSNFDVSSPGGLNISALNTLYTIDFDNTVDKINQGTFNASGISNVPSNGRLNSSGIAILGMSDGSVDFDSTNTSGDFARGTSTGGVSTGGMYAFQVATGDYALGFQPTGSDFDTGKVVLRLYNGTNDTIKSFLISGNIYEYNDQGRSTNIQVQYSASPSGGFTTFSDASISSVEVADGSPQWINSLYMAESPSITWLSGDYYYIRFSFSDNGGSGSRDEIALDNLKIIAYKNDKTNVGIASAEGTYNTLLLNGNNGIVNATGKVTVRNTLKLKNGFLNLNTDTIDLGTTTNDCSVTDASSSSFLYNGPIKYYVNSSTGTYKFELGSSTSNYSRAEINFNSSTLAAGSFLLASVTDANHPNLPGHVQNYISRYWTVESNGISSQDYDITLNYTDSDVTGTESTFLPVKYAGSSWTAPRDVGNNNVDTVGSGSVNVSTNTLSWNNVDSFSIFTGVGDGSPLPVELVEFNGKTQQEGVLLQWKTASESFSSHFEIQRMLDSQTSETIGWVNAQGSSNEIVTYRYLDRNANDSKCYYRLKQVDLDGKAQHSNIIEVNRNHTPTEPLRINNRGNSLFIVSTSEEIVRLEISTISGQVMQRVNAATNTKIRLNELDNGIYVIRIWSKGQLTLSEKLVVTR